MSRLRAYAQGDAVLRSLASELSRHRGLRGAPEPSAVAQQSPTQWSTEPPSIFLADDIEVLHRVLALEVVTG